MSVPGLSDPAPFCRRAPPQEARDAPCGKAALKFFLTRFSVKGKAGQKTSDFLLTFVRNRTIIEAVKTYDFVP